MAELVLASGLTERPFATFVDQTSEVLTAAVIEAGFSAYAVDVLSASRLKPVPEAMISRFKMMQRMRRGLSETKRAMEERKVIDHEKGMIMKSRNMTEDEAYAVLRRDGPGRTGSACR